MNAGHPETMSCNLNKMVNEINISAVATPSAQFLPVISEPLSIQYFFLLNIPHRRTMSFIFRLFRALIYFFLSLYALPLQASFSLCLRLFYVILYHHLFLVWFFFSSHLFHFPLSLPLTAVASCSPLSSTLRRPRLKRMTVI